MAMSPRLLRPRASGFNPRSISGLSLWLDSSDASTLYDATSGGSLVAADGAVARWEDKSGNAKHATQTTANNRPLRKTAVQSGRDALRFDGSNDGMSVSALTLSSHMSAFVVSSTTRTGNNLKFWMEHSSDINSSAGFFFNGTYAGAWAVRRPPNPAIHDGPAVDNTDWIGSGWALAAFRYDGVGEIYKNGALVSNVTRTGTSRVNSDVTDSLFIAARGGSTLPLTGDIGEILIYSRVLTAAEMSRVAAGLNAKWKMY